ncbi:MAG: proline reductase cluster protein PrdD [Proteocatella sp.]
METINLRRLVIRAFHVNEVVLADKFEFNHGILKIDKKITNKLIAQDPVIKDVKIEIIKPYDHDRQINTIMDIIPMSAKALGTLGEGITYTMTGAYVMLTGCDADGRQMHEFGSSEGNLKDKMVFGKAGTPAKSDYIIHVDVLVEGGLPYDRKLPIAAFKACDEMIQSIRCELKKLEPRDADEVHEFYDRVRTGAKKIAIVKQIAGQGAMYDNQLFPAEPSGYSGGLSIIDMANMPIVLSPNEYRDGALRSMT